MANAKMSEKQTIWLTINLITSLGMGISNANKKISSNRKYLAYLKINPKGIQSPAFGAVSFHYNFSFVNLSSNLKVHFAWHESNSTITK